MIQYNNKIFCLKTKNSSYLFRVMETGHLEHLYYGRSITAVSPHDMTDTVSKTDAVLNAPIDYSDTAEVLSEKHAFAPGNTNVYDREHKNFTLEDVRLEMSSYGKGDIREPFIEVVHEDGSATSDFLYENYAIAKHTFKEESALPFSYDEQGEAEHLCITLSDRQYRLRLELHYYVYEDCDVITRNAVLYNDSTESVKLLRLMSMQLDLDTKDYILSTFNGGWAREMNRTDIPLRAGKHVNSSYTGTSSSRANPFIMLGKKNTDEDHGDCFGFNLVYSGNHYEAAEVSSFGKTRVTIGVNPRSFCFRLAPGEQFESPEAVMTYSHEGYNGMSHHMHDFVREHIVRGVWKRKVRPVLLNSWEAAYFSINESKLLKLAKAGKEAGIELFVMDDGWFGERNDDAHSLGDWEADVKKLPGGLSGIARKLKEIGLDFGIWVEPEMVNCDSRLYRAHPEWVIEIPDKPHSEGRNQRILDLCNPQVQDFIIEEMSRVFGSAPISYVKWDMNRTFTDYYSKYLPPERQGEVMHRYYLGLYRCMKELTKRFPEILFEGCCAGGNRFDLGILCYFPQIWASDNTDALCRVKSQQGYSYGYPMSVVSAHVSSCPNHQTLRNTPLETRFHVAAFGVCGYECNFCDMKREELEAVKAQIALYKEWREVLQFGTFYRGRNIGEDGLTEWTCVAKDGEKAVGFIMQALVEPNTFSACYYPKGLLPDRAYHFRNRELKYNIKEFGDLVNTAAPIHIRQDSLFHNVVARFVKMDGEIEDAHAYGDTLMYGGVHLKQGFAATGYNEQVRFFQDFASRMYFMTAE